jgi:WD40 repeat protein
MALQISNASTGEPYLSLPSHSLPVTCVAFSADGIRLATGSHDTTIKLWDTATGALLQTLSGHTAAVEAIAFLPSPNPNEYHLVSASRDHTLRHWSAHHP